MLLRVHVDTTRGNVAIKDGTVQRVVGEFMEKYKPEAAYFFPDKGKRSALFVFDVQDSSQLPAVGEGFFIELDAEVEVVPVMNLDDLQNGLASAFGS